MNLRLAFQFWARKPISRNLFPSKFALRMIHICRHIRLYFKVLPLAVSKLLRFLSLVAEFVILQGKNIGTSDAKRRGIPNKQYLSCYCYCTVRHLKETLVSSKRQENILFSITFDVSRLSLKVHLKVMCLI